MSGESERHIRLVEWLVDEIRRRHRAARDLVLFADHRSYIGERPPNIGGYIPDVFASDLPETFRVVGEAKTPSDLETERSRRQLAAFLDHLSLYPVGMLYLAVPFLSAPRARFILRSIERPEHGRLRVEVLPCLLGAR